MSKKPNLILPLLLLVGTTLAIGGIVYGLLWKESERLRKNALASANEQAETVVENIGLTIGEIKTAIMQALLQFEGPNFAPQLSTWQEEDAFVDFAFVWSKENPNTVRTFPAGAFDGKTFDTPLQRSDESWLWQPAKFGKDEERLTVLSNLASEEADSFSNYAENESLRKSIRSQSQLSTRIAKSSAPASQPRWTSDSSQWIHETIGQQSYWIGYASWNKGTSVTGAGVNLSQLREVLNKSFPSELVSTIERFEIRDPSGTVVASSGNPSSYADRSGLLLARSSTTLPIGPDLPGWTLDMLTNVEGSLSSILLNPAGFATALVLLVLFAAGLWLAYQSRSSQIDAAEKVSFVANVSHELKTPLTTIRMFSELLQSGRISAPEKRNNYLNTISKESQRLTRLVNNVLDFSRIDRGLRTIDAKQQDLTSVLHEYLEIRRADLKQAGMELVSHLPEPSTEAYFDRDALCQILGNLIDNAIKYAHSGKLLRIHVTETERYVEIAVTDNGKGLPSSLRKKRFAAFRRGDDSLTTETSGFGLGLSISQTLAEAMEATLSYDHPRRSHEQPTFLLRLSK